MNAYGYNNQYNTKQKHLEQWRQLNDEIKIRLRSGFKELTMWTKITNFFDKIN